MPYICVFEAPPPSTPAPGTAVGLSHMIESYAAEKTHARMCDAMRDALRSQPARRSREHLLPGVQRSAMEADATAVDAQHDDAQRATQQRRELTNNSID